MNDFIAEFSKNQTKDVNSSLFDRTKEQSIAEFIVSGLKVIESLPYITFTGWEHITDASKIDVKLNRKHIKSKAILKDKDISRIVSIRDTAQEMLNLKFRIDYDGETRYVSKSLLIPSYIDQYHFLINGKLVLPQKQIVDMSTYTQKRSVKLKTTLTPIDLYREPVKLPFESTDELRTSIKTFVLNLFTKEINPLYYFFAKFGVKPTIKYFGLKDLIDIVDTEYDREINCYFRANKEVLVEVDRRAFMESEFVRTFAYMVYDMIGNRDKFDAINDVDFWIVKLGSIFTTNTKNHHSKGLNVLVSFERILDDITKSTLRLGKRNLTSTYSLIRWMIGNYQELRRKDNHDFGNKRLRCNEVTAFYYIQSMTYRVNTLLNKKKITIESIEKIFNWNPDELFRAMISAKNSLLKYDPEINDFDMLNGLRMSQLGAQGITGGKNISSEFRDIYPSHLGRIDLNGISHGKNTALTGFLTPKCKIYGNGFFSKESQDPDEYHDYIRHLKERLKDKAVDSRKVEIEKLKDARMHTVDQINGMKGLEIRDNCFVIHRRYKVLQNMVTNMAIISARKSKDPFYKRTYIDANGIVNTEDNLAVIKRRKKLENEDGYVSISHHHINQEVMTEDKKETLN